MWLFGNGFSRNWGYLKIGYFWQWGLFEVEDPFRNIVFLIMGTVWKFSLFANEDFLKIGWLWTFGLSEMGPFWKSWLLGNLAYSWESWFLKNHFKQLKYQGRSRESTFCIKNNDSRLSPEVPSFDGSIVFSMENDAEPIKTSFLRFNGEKLWFVFGPHQRSEMFWLLQG